MGQEGLGQEGLGQEGWIGKLGGWRWMERGEYRRERFGRGRGVEKPSVKISGHGLGSEF